MPTIKLQLGDFDFQRLTELSCREKQSRTALLTEGLRQGFVDHERRILRLPPEEFEACVRVMTTPETDPVVLARRQKTKNNETCVERLNFL